MLKAELSKILENFAYDKLEHKIKLKVFKAGKFRIKPEQSSHLVTADIQKPLQPRLGISNVETLVVAMIL